MKEEGLCLTPKIIFSFDGNTILKNNVDLLEKFLARSAPTEMSEKRSLDSLFIDSLSAAYNSISSVLSLPPLKEPEKVITREVNEQIHAMVVPQSAQVFIRIAGISGALAVGLGAYGSHAFRHKDVDKKLIDTYEIANKYHYIHTLALLSVPLVRKPVLTGSLLTLGMTLFCGSCYYHSLTENQTIRRVTPYGGVVLILAWLSMFI